MRVAVPVWQGRVSPVFDVAGRVLLVELDGTAERCRREELLGDDAPDRRAGRLAALGVTQLICCAISRPLELLIVARGIEVIPRVCGEVDDVLRAFCTGELSQERFAMPGCCATRRRRRRGRCRSGRRGPMHEDRHPPSAN
jgi:predicted Fe-Mo cluster-binding NifX family protein